jgi:uncharacterized protein
MKLNILIMILIALSITPTALAKEGNIKLLAVSDDGSGNLSGSVADLHLDIQPGKGRVFIETFPLTKTDTQITTRFAKEIACKYADIDCTQYDFFYTISAETAIIGGPSAGAATTVLTVALLKGLDLDKNTVITGTINSGEVIGVVSGLRQKIDAASKENLTTVLVARGAEMIKEKNITTNITAFGRSLGVNVVQVGDVDEALQMFTGKSFQKKVDDIKPDPEYIEVMKGVADSLCKKTEELYSGTNISDSLKNITQRSKEFYEKGRYYTSASLCFGNNVDLRQLQILQQNLTRASIAKEATALVKEITSFNNNNITNTTRNTITDLEAYMIAKERLEDAIRSLAEIPSENIQDDAQTLAYAHERLQSSIVWSSFFGKTGKAYILDSESMKSSCIEKLSETEERYDYVFSTLPSDITDIRKDIELAKAYEKEGDYELCLFTASKAKARVNTILSSFYTSNEELNTTIALKQAAIRKVIARQMEKGLFPILGYSYYEYSQDLKESDPYLSFFYAEYALETSDLDLYFKAKKNSIKEPSVLDMGRIEMILLFILGTVLGGLFMYFWTHRKKSTKIFRR